MPKRNASAFITKNQLFMPIHEAAANGHVDIAKWLLGHEQAVNASKLDPLFVDWIESVAQRHGQLATTSAIAEQRESDFGANCELHLRPGYRV